MSSDTNRKPRHTRWRWIQSIIILIIMAMIAGSALEAWRNRNLDKMQISTSQPTYTTIDNQKVDIFRDSYDQTVLVYIWEIGRASCRERVCLYV